MGKILLLFCLFLGLNLNLFPKDLTFKVSTSYNLNLELDTNKCSVLDQIKFDVHFINNCSNIRKSNFKFRLNNLNHINKPENIMWRFPSLKDTIFGTYCTLDSIVIDTNFCFYLNSQISGTNLNVSLEEDNTEKIQFSDDFDFIAGKTDSLDIILPDKIYERVEFDLTIIPIDTFGNINYSDDINFKLTARNPDVMGIHWSTMFINGPETYSLISCDTISNQWIKYYDAKRKNNDSVVSWNYITSPKGQTACFEVLKYVGIEENKSVPSKYNLFQNYPNPFNPTTTIKYALPNDDFVKLTVFNSLGKEIKVLVNNKQNSGYHTVKWNAENIPSGVYIYKLETTKFTDINRCLLIK